MLQGQTDVFRKEHVVTETEGKRTISWIGLATIHSGLTTTITEGQGREGGEPRNSSYFTAEDVRRFSGENGQTQLVSCYSPQLGKIFLQLHLPISQTKEKQKQGEVFVSDLN